MTASGRMLRGGFYRNCKTYILLLTTTFLDISNEKTIGVTYSHSRHIHAKELEDLVVKVKRLPDILYRTVYLS